MAQDADISAQQMMQAITNFGIADLIGMKIEYVEPGIGKVRIQIDNRLMHPQMIVHGGIIFTLADTAMSMAILSTVPPNTRFSTIEAKINFLLPVRTGELVAEAAFIHQGRTISVLEATVFNITGEERKAVARIMGTFSIAQPKNTDGN